MRIWVSRPEPGAARTARRLEGLGHTVLVTPVLRIVATGAPVPEGAFDGLILTSGNAVTATDGLPRDRPVFAVGARTAERARRAGFLRVHCAEGDAGDLAALVARTLPPGRLLHAAGEDRKAEPAASLAAAGFSVTIWSAYAARAETTLPEAASLALLAGEGAPEAALHFSRRSAQAAAGLCLESGLEKGLKGGLARGLAGAFRALKHYCLSPDVEAGLAEFGVAAHFVATRPSEDALLAGLPAPDRAASPREA